MVPRSMTFPADASRACRNRRCGCGDAGPGLVPIENLMHDANVDAVDHSPKMALPVRCCSQMRPLRAVSKRDTNTVGKDCWGEVNCQWPLGRDYYVDKKDRNDEKGMI